MKTENPETFDEGDTQIAEEEFCLSDKEFECNERDVILSRDVKEFIRRLKEDLKRIYGAGFLAEMNLTIDKLAGEKLI